MNYTKYSYSITITDQIGDIIENRGGVYYERKMNAWGRARDSQKLYYTTTNPFGSGSDIRRGYTFHEHLEEFNLINMNGRLYDPVLGRMLSPDNYIQAPENTQSYNRYSYCVNNPLKYTDPTGEVFGFDDAIIIGAAIYSGYQAGSAVNGGKDIGKWDWNAKTFGSIALGAGTALIGGYGAAGIVAGGGAMSGTLAIVAGSYTSSVGMHIATGGQSKVSIGFGAGSYNVDDNSFDGIWNWGDNSGLENLGYSLGALANLSDVTNVIDGFTHWEEKLAAKSKAYMDKWTKDNPNAQVDAASLHVNGGTRSYPSYFGNNPRWWNPILKNGNGAWADYMGMVEDWGWKEYPGYLHDAEYIEMGINKGAKFLLGSWKTYGADIRLTGRTLYLSLKHRSPFDLGISGLLGVSAIQKVPYGWAIRKP
jgi:RHS repeat-associated protein